LNKALQGNGGAIYTTVLTNLNNDYFYQNDAYNSPSTGGCGGAVYSNAPEYTQLTDTSSQYIDNYASVNGGAIDTVNNTSLTDDILTGNTAGQAGGAILNGEDNQLNVYGSAFNDNSAGTNGGAIENLGSLTVQSSADAGSVFSYDTAANNGGAIDSNNGTPNGQLTATNVNFTGNTATGGNGGAINTFDNTTLTNDNFGAVYKGQAPNTSKSRGGAVDAEPTANNPAATLSVSGCKFSGNYPTSLTAGGAIYTEDETTVTTSNFFNNQAQEGGAIAYGIDAVPAPANTSYLQVEQDYFEQNGPGPGQTVGEGGAIYSVVVINSGAVNVGIYNSTFYNNGTTGRGQDNDGGAVKIAHTTTGTGTATAQFNNDTFYLNKSSDHGGAMSLYLNNTGTGTNTAGLTSLTVYGNTAGGDSGGVFVGAGQPGTVAMDNNILDGNTVSLLGYNGPVDVTLVANNILNDIGYNLVGSSDTMFVNGVNHDIVDNNNAPGVANQLALNNAKPGYQVTLALQTAAPASPAYETGDPSQAGSIDERGYTRQAGKVSIGAEDPDAQ
jgi:predicted outer membrane repeat protein